MASTTATRLSKKSMRSMRVAVPLRRQTANRLIRRGTMAISRPKVISQAAALPHITSALLR